MFLAHRIRQLQPDMIIVNAESDARDAHKHGVMATRHERRPIVMFTNNRDSSHARAAVAAGVAAYVVAALPSKQIHPILDIALARFKQLQALRAGSADARSELKDRKIIDRAKGLLMQRQQLTEEAASAKRPWTKNSSWLTRPNACSMS